MLLPQAPQNAAAFRGAIMTTTENHKREERRLRRILRIREVEAITGKRESSIYEDIAAGTFPAPVPIGPRAVGWLEDELADWQDQQIAARAARVEQRRREEQAA
jgi:prophage regulatory protein